MQRSLAIITAIIAAGVVLAACSTASRVENEALAEEFEDAPEWVLGHSENAGPFEAVGAARIGKAGVQFARTEALAHGRSELARQVSVKVKDLVNNFAQQIGNGKNQSSDQFSEQVSKLVTQETLAGSRQKDLWISPSSDLYVLVEINPEQAKAAIKSGIVSNYRDDDVRWQAFEARDGNQTLDEEIEKTFGQNR